MNPIPSVSVLMAVYNGGSYLRSAVESLLSQTLTDFEIVIVDDGSTDDTSATIVELTNSDNRIKPHRNNQNLGLIASLNVGLSLCSGDIVARADADDLFHPDRLRIQLDYLRRHSDVGVLGAAVSFIDSSGDPVDRTLHDFPLDSDQVRVHSMLGCCLWHTTVMFRKELVNQVGGYRPELAGGPEDYDLWATLLPLTRIVNLPEPLAYQRLHGQSITANWDTGFSLYCDVANRLIEEYLERSVSKTEVKSLVTLCGCDGGIGDIDVDSAICLFGELYQAVKKQESRSTTRHFRDKCVHGLLRQSATLVYEQPALCRRLLSTCFRVNPGVLCHPKIYGVTARLLTPNIIRQAVKAAP